MENRALNIPAKKIAYDSPFIPAEWITAHGFEACRGIMDHEHDNMPINVDSGVCPYMSDFVNSAAQNPDVRAIVLTTTCDQMRRAKDFIDMRSDKPCFLMNIPSSWQNKNVLRVYSDELKRLSSFLISLGGIKKDEKVIDSFMRRERKTRKNLLNEKNKYFLADTIPVALLGGHFSDNDHEIIDLIEEMGGTVVLDGTYEGERVLPLESDIYESYLNSAELLTKIYFEEIPDVFKRPNNRLFDWVREKIIENNIKAVVLVRYLFCDKWHAESLRLKEIAGLPFLDIELDGKKLSRRTKTNVQAFMEMLNDRESIANYI
ncbi:MAG: 2-hydroxyacyl-CoA dehydratase [Candidatus Omnitrophica bacterium]|nr:2-hydroxyacyl-CoA dehydratase [Candidatus Omnitrophota bacterium]